MDIFLDTEATKEAVIQAGIAIFQYIYHGQDTTLGYSHSVTFRAATCSRVVKYDRTWLQSSTT